MKIELHEEKVNQRSVDDMQFPFLARRRGTGDVVLVFTQYRGLAVTSFSMQKGDSPVFMAPIDDDRWEVLPKGSEVTFAQV